MEKTSQERFEKRPYGVTILALHRFFVGGFWIVLGLWYATGGTWKLVSVKVYLIFVAEALLETAIGVGLWRLKNWARLLAALSIALWPASGVVFPIAIFYLSNPERLIGMPWYFRASAVLEPIIRIGMVVYLLLPRVQRCFRTIHSPNMS